MESHQKNLFMEEDAKGRHHWSSEEPFHFESGGQIQPLELVFETIGKLSPAQDNVILVHHALSTNSHICSHAKNPEPGWWEAVVGPGKTIDTNRFFVICINNLGSCFGSSGPISINPKTLKPYRVDFPQVTIGDMVRSQVQLLQALGIKRLYAVIGNSMGAMLSLTLAIQYPEIAERLISVSSCYKSDAVSIATHQIQKEIIMLDPDWKNGYYEHNPQRGFTIARKYGLLSYRNPNELNARFSEGESINSYLEYNAHKFITVFDANAYLYIQAAMDGFDVTQGYVDKLEPFRKIKASSLVVSVTSDLLFPPSQQEALFANLQDAGVAVTYVAHDSPFGHDAFYADATINQHIQRFLEN